MESKSHLFGSHQSINRPAMSTRPIHSHLTTYSNMKQTNYQKVTGPNTSIVNTVKINTNIG